MSYKTPSIGNRLGISFGWNNDLFIPFHTYGSSIQNSVKLYFFVKEYFNKRNVMLITYNFSKHSTYLSLFLNIYRYQKTFNVRKKQFKKIKAKLITNIQSGSFIYRKRTKKRFRYKWVIGYKPLKTNAAWRSMKLTELKTKNFEIRKLLYENKKQELLNRHKKIKTMKVKSLKPKKRRRRRNRLKGWVFQFKKVNKFLHITHINKYKIKKFGFNWRKLRKLKKRRRRKTILCLQKKLTSVGRSFLAIKKNMRLSNYRGKRLHQFSPEFYNAFISLIALRFKLRLFLRTKKFNITRINISEPIKTSNKKSIKLYSRSHWYRQIRKKQFFINTIRLLHLMEKFPNPALLADHFAMELAKIKKKHWNLIRAFTTILRYWRFHNARLLKKIELQRNKGRDLNTKKIKKWIPRYKLYSSHDSKKSIRGIKMNIKGKINAKDRSRLKVLQEGIIPIQSFNKNVRYALAYARAQTGVFGIKVWLFT